MAKSQFLMLSLATIVLFSCTNDPKPASGEAAAPEIPQLDLQAVTQTTTMGNADIAEMQLLIQAINSLPAGVKTKYASDIENTLVELNGMLEKESVMVADLKAMLPVQQQDDGKQLIQGATSDSGSDPVAQANTFKTNKEDLERYHERVKAIQEQLKTWSSQQ
jgi:hypothetical protein